MDETKKYHVDLRESSRCFRGIFGMFFKERELTCTNGGRKISSREEILNAVGVMDKVLSKYSKKTYCKNL